MKTNLIKLGLVVGLSSSLLGFTYQIKDGWQQLGAITDTNLSIFDDKCIDYLWYYDNTDSSNPQWKLHIANGNDYNYCGETIDTVKKGEGFWAKASGECNVTIAEPTTIENNCTAGIPTPPNIEDPSCSTCDGNITVTHNGITYGTVVSPYTGRIWLDRNLGASRVCTSNDDSQCFVAYYQWGREADGHEKSNSSTTSTKATDRVNVGSSFITGTDDWTTADTNGSLRSANWSKTDGSSVCPVGFRVPTIDEITVETIDKGLTTLETLYNSFLKLPKGNYRHYNGNMQTLYIWGMLWSSTSSESPTAWDLSHGNYRESTNIATDQYKDKRTFGLNIRCIKD